MQLRNFNALAACLVAGTVALSASAEQKRFEFQELSGEDICAAIVQAGGSLCDVVRDDDGVIISLSASGSRSICEYEHDEISEVLESLQASVAPKKPLGDLAQTSVSSTLTLVGSTTNSSTAVVLTSAATFPAGAAISGTGIPSSTTASVAGTALTLSQAATASGGSVTLTVTFEQQVIGLSEWTIDWKRKTVDTTTTDDAEYESSQGSTKSWTAKAKYMFIDSETSQESNILTAIDSLQVDSVLWNFFPTVETGRAAFQGLAIVDGITLTSGMGKVVGLDVSLKGTGPLVRLAQTAPVANSATVTGIQAEV